IAITFRRVHVMLLGVALFFSGRLLYAADTTQSEYTRSLWKVQDGLPEDTVQALAETSDGYLWIGTTGGLTRFDGTRFVLYGSNILPSPGVNSIFCLSASKDGSLWIGTEGGGMLHLKNNQVKSYGTPEGLTDGFVRSILEDRHGTVWVGTDNGLYQVVGDRVKRVEMAPGMEPQAVH